MSFIDVENLSFIRGKKKIFENISLKIEESKITAIIGPSGCGKTTLLKLISTQYVDYLGYLKFRGKDIKTFSDDEIYSFRKNIGILFQNGALFTDLTVYENIEFPIKEHTNLSDSLIKDLVFMKLQSVGLRKVDDLMPSQLSLGMAKRVALARAIALDPEIIMYDEPFAGQDPISMSILLKLIKLLNKCAKVTTIIVSHDILETLEIADYVYVINEKKVIEEGPPSFILNSTNSFVKSFVDIKYLQEDFNNSLFEGYEKKLLFD